MKPIGRFRAKSDLAFRFFPRRDTERFPKGLGAKDRYTRKVPERHFLRGARHGDGHLVPAAQGGGADAGLRRRARARVRLARRPPPASGDEAPRAPRWLPPPPTKRTSG